MSQEKLFSTLITLEDAVSLNQEEFNRDFRGSMFAVWASLQRWNHYEVERSYRCNIVGRWQDRLPVPGEIISSMNNDEIFMWFCFVLLSEDRWPFE